MSPFSRRELLVAGGGLLVLTACSGSGRASPSPATPGSTSASTPASSAAGAAVGPTDPAVEARDAARRSPAASTVSAVVDAAPVDVDIAGRHVSTWAYGDRPGTGGIRADVGDLVEARFTNHLPSANTVHWHGIALRNDMDGVHDLTQPAVASGAEFLYRFTVPDAGTYWFHPHMGLELDRGLYAPLIVEDPAEQGSPDVDATLMFDDWLDGWGRSAQDVLAELQSTGGHSGHPMDTSSGGMGGMGDMGGSTTMMGGLGGDVTYPLHVVNGRAPDDREIVDARPGQRVRLRLINAASDTAYRVAVAGHRLTVTHADGFPVVPVEVDHLVLGMGERYDVVITADDGAFPIVAIPEGKSDPAAEALLRTSAGATATVGSRPSALDGRSLRYADLLATDAVRLAARPPDRSHTVALTASAGYVHGIDGATFPDAPLIEVHQGERLRLTVANQTMMFHPIHLHGHTFQLVGDGSARKDTVNVLPMSSVTFDVEADNPGQWMFHCHNTYHLETGMATLLSYRS